MKYVHYLTVLAIFWFGFSVNAETLNSNGGIGGTGASEEEEIIGGIGGTGLRDMERPELLERPDLLDERDALDDVLDSGITEDSKPPDLERPDDSPTGQ